MSHQTHQALQEKVLQEGLELEEDRNAYRSTLIGHEALLSKNVIKMKRNHSSQSVSSGRLSHSASKEIVRLATLSAAGDKPSVSQISSSSEGAYSHRSVLSRADIEGIE